MGLSTHIYLGPFVEATHRNTTREVDVWGCTKPDCPEYENREQGSRPGGRFCPTCASPIDKSKKTVPWRQWIYDLFNEEEDLSEVHDDHQGPTIRIIVNTFKDAPRDFHPDEHEENMDLTTVSQTEEIKWFETRFAKELDLLRGAYDNVTVRWGLHVWLS